MPAVGWQAVWDAAKALDTDLSGMSWNGFNIAGDKASIDEVRRLMNLADRCASLDRVILGERKERQKCSDALRAKDAAMGVLFERLNAAGVDCSDLIS